MIYFQVSVFTLSFPPKKSERSVQIFKLQLCYKFEHHGTKYLFAVTWLLIKG